MVEITGILSTVGEYELVLIESRKRKQMFLDEKDKILASFEEDENSVEKIKILKMEAQKSVDEINLSVAEHDEKLKELNNKMNYILFGGGKNVDLEIIKKQINEEKADRSVLEDGMIELWEKIERVEKEIEDAKESLEDLRVEIDKKNIELDEKIKKTDKDIKHITKCINESIEQLNPDNTEVYNMYLRLQEKEVQPSAVAIVDGNCHGCFLDLPPDIVNKIREGNPTKCPNCYRILYFKEEGEEE